MTLPHRADTDDAAAVLQRARARFVQSFPDKCASLTRLASAVEEDVTHGPVGTLKELVHNMTGVAGTVGFPTVSARAADLEQLLVAMPALSPLIEDIQFAVQALCDAFTTDIQGPRPGWDVAPPVPREARLLVVEDDPVQQELLRDLLTHAGYRPVCASTGQEALVMARTEHPALILLDVNLPDIDGYEVCRLLKASSEAAGTPVVFVTTRSNADDRLMGLALGADDYLQKPVDARELLLRVGRLLSKDTPPAPSGSPDDTALSYEAFVRAATETLAGKAAVLALIRHPMDAGARVREALAGILRRCDLVACYDRTHVLTLMVELPLTAATARLTSVADALKARGVERVSAGIAGTSERNEKSLDVLMREADEALVDVQAARADAGKERAVVVLADDDPDMMHIVDAQMKASGYRTVLAFDGQQTLDAVESAAPHLLVLDLMMPRLTGFDVLGRLHTLTRRPRTIVLSARGREDDVTRAFSLGADDYMTKPFSPQELLARAARLLR